MKEEKMWGIMNLKFGLYTGLAFTRRTAIGDHCTALKKTWQECRKDGDRAVKVNAAYWEPTK